MNFYRHLAWLLGLFFCLTSCDCTKTKSLPVVSDQLLSLGEGRNSFALIYSTSVRGYVEPCGCTSQPLGGLARLSTVLHQIRDHFSLGSVFIDGGDLLFDTSTPFNPADLCAERARVDLLLSTLHDLKLEGSFAGSFDDTMGAAFRTERMAQHQVADLSDKAQKGMLLGPDRFKIGLLLLDEKTVALDDKARDLKDKGANAIVVVSRLSRVATQEVAKGLSDVDVVILGAVSEETPASAEALSPNGPFLVSAAKQGQYLGLVVFHRHPSHAGKWTLDARKQQLEQRQALLLQRKKTLEKQIEQSSDTLRRDFLNARLTEVKREIENLKTDQAPAPVGNFIEANAIALTRSIPSDPEIAKRLSQYEQSIASLVSQCEANVDCPKAAPGKAVYVGAENCKSCHAAAYDFWKKAVYKVDASDPQGQMIHTQSGHAKAWATLEKAQKTEDRSCVGCHSTGFMQAGGFCKVKEVAKLSNVQCEACHGAGSLHAASGDKRLIKKAVPESQCRECHHVPHIPTTESFVYEEKLQRILGEGHGLELLRRLQHQPSAQ